MKSLPDLDDKCLPIFFTLLIHGELRFKDLKNILKSEYKTDMPEATLLMHLNHLIELKLVTKTIKSAKNVTYKPDTEKLKELQEGVKAAIELRMHWLKSKEAFLRKPIKEQIETIEYNALLFELAFLKHQILFEKYRKLEDGLMSKIFASCFFRVLEGLIIKRCLENEDYMKSVLEHLDNEIKRLG